MSSAYQPTDTARRTLVAGVGNVFLGDDGFGVEAVRRLAAHALPGHVEVADFGVRAVHLAYRLLEGYGTAILVDASSHGGEPGTVYLIDATPTADAPPPGGPVLDGHRMTPDTVLAILRTLSAGTGGARPERLFVVGCEPADVGERMGLSAPVAAALDEAVRLILRVVRGEDPLAPTVPDPAAAAAVRTERSTP